MIRPDFRLPALPTSCSYHSPCVSHNQSARPCAALCPEASQQHHSRLVVAVRSSSVFPFLPSAVKRYVKEPAQLPHAFQSEPASPAPTPSHHLTNPPTDLTRLTYSPEPSNHFTPFALHSTSLTSPHARLPAPILSFSIHLFSCLFLLARFSFTSCSLPTTMPAQRYERIAGNDDEDTTSPSSPQAPYPIPTSPPPSFHSRASSPSGGASRRLLSDDPLTTDADRTLADTFDAESDSDDEETVDDRQRLMRGNPEDAQSNEEDDEDMYRGGLPRRDTQLPTFTPQAPSGRVVGGGQNDGVFANLSAKPTRGEDAEEKPPTYEQAAADAAPPYWETTILAPGAFGDEVFVEGLPVGSVFSFVWNAMISMSFQFVGFLLTYLLHTTHAAKNGSRAGLGITLVQWGFTMKSAASSPTNDNPTTVFDGGAVPSDPNAHDFDPNSVSSSGGSDLTPVNSGISTSDWVAYALMIVGWFILIKSVSDFIRARRHEQLVLQSPDRGLGVAVVAEGESPERSV
ncbi:unnamed protein product [Periconia digitata]|uniref:Metal homeostatis protein bsd2 n=1 Tax=Periconia digitata TaxID=1303443 RepID=A0A9W4XP46_9PLEO|nr:unnamed protein product [Periconia digitata]